MSLRVWLRLAVLWTVGAMLLAVCAPAQVIGLQPTPIGLYTWNSGSGQWEPVTGAETSNPYPNTPQAFAFYVYNATLGQWVPCTSLTSCFGAGSGTVTSVGLSSPGVLYTVSGSPVTTSGTLALNLISQTANTVLAGPSLGSAAAPSFRALVAADLPAGTVPTWPASGELVLSNGTNSPAGLAPVNGDCVLGAGGAWTVGTCGSSTSPGGSNTDVQINSSGVFGGSPNFTWASNLLTLSGGISLSGASGNGNFLMNGLTSIVTTPSGFGTVSTDTVIGNGGTGGSLGNYTGLIYSTTSTFSSGVSSITVASAGTPIIGQGLVTNAAIVGPGVQAGTTISSFSGTTVNLSLPTNAPETGATIQVGPASTSGLILIGNDAGPNIVAGTGIVGIGQNVLQSCVTSGQDGEDNNSVVVGPDAAQNETCEETPQPSGALYGSTYQYTFEDVILGIKSDESGNANASSQFIGNHIQIPTYSQLTTLIGGNLGQQFGSPSNSFTNFYLTVGIGGNLFGSAPSANNTLYSAGFDVFISPGGLGCWYDTSFVTIVGAALGYDGASACSTLSTATNSVLVASPGSNTLDINHIAANWTSGSGDVMVVAKGNGGFYGGGVTTGSYDAIFGPGAGAAVATGSYDSLFGEDAAPHYAGTALVSIGAQSFYSHTGTTSSSWYNTCAGYECFYTTTAGSALTGVGALVGYNETANYDTLVGALTGDRSVASAGYLTAEGYEELYDTSNANAADQFLAFLGGSSDCTNAAGCTYGISLGWSANITAAAHATQIDQGTNATSNTVQYRSWNFLDKNGNINTNFTLTSVATLASASTVTPTASVSDVTGSTAINTINLPSSTALLVNGGVVNGLCVTFVQTGTAYFTTAGNVAYGLPLSNWPVGTSARFCYNASDTKWYPPASAGMVANPMQMLGQIIYGNTGGTPAALAGNTTTTPEFYTSTGTGSAAQAPTLTSSTGTGSVVLSGSPTFTGLVSVANLQASGNISLNGTGPVLTVGGGTNFGQFDLYGGFSFVPTSATGSFSFTGSPTATRTITFPDATGTVALTSNLSSYLPLTGGTMSGILDVVSIGQSAASNTAGTCTMSSGTSCTQTIAHTYTTPVCIATQQSATLSGGAGGCTVSGTTVTVTATTANSETWGFWVFGNPS